MIFLFFLFLAIFGLLYATLNLGKRGKSLPPGPPTLPILGNLHQMPKKGAFLKFTEWSQQYGKIYSLKIGPSTMIVLTSRRLIRELLDKRSAKYSHRPPSYVSYDLISQGEHFLVMQYGPLWRTFRKIAHQHFMESVVEKNYVPVQNAEAVQMLRDFCLRPDLHMLHAQRFSNSVIMSLVFGIRTPTVETDHMRRLYHILENWVQIMEPGATPPVDIYPLFHWLPQSLYRNWIATAKGIGADMNSLYSDLLTRVRKRRQNGGTRRASVMDMVLDQNEKLGLSEHQLYFLGGVLVEGGSETTSSVIQSFIHAMTKWPGILQKAQAEIDAVVGKERTPIWEDYDKLPYVAATVKEAMRWRPAVPLAFPHATVEDDWIDGYLIPKGSSIILNTWGLHRDPEQFSDPDIFDPDHFKGKTALAPNLATSVDVNNRDHYGYGAGRRICPGMHLAERNLFLVISKIIWAFHILPGVDKEGSEIEPDIDPSSGYKEGLALSVLPFSCRAIVRSEVRRGTIEKEFEQATRDVFSGFES